MLSPRGARVFFWSVAAASAVIGASAALFYAQHNLTLSHYDARAHLVVARRIVDSLTPGWQQIGAVWLPLPHVLNAGPVLWDWSYRTGFSGVVLSVASLSVGLAAVATWLRHHTGSTSAAWLVAGLVLLNPNILYLQSTPMTEPLLIGLSFLALVLVARWVEDPAAIKSSAVGAALVALMLTRYEGWPIAGTLAACAVLARGRRAWPFFRYVVGAALGFFVLGWATTGNWFMTSGFFVPDNPSRHHPLAVLEEIDASTRQLGGDVLVWAAAAGVVVCLAGARRSVASLLPLCLLAAAALPAFAFFEGHPHRVRYMVPIVAACGVLASMAVAQVPRRIRPWAAVVLLGLSVWSRHPLDPRAAMVTEAQWETPFRQGRATVSRYLDQAYDGTPILASMGSLAHYMQEASWHGLDIAEFLHEGNGKLWVHAVASPRHHVRWVLVEERAEGGDVLAARQRDDSSFLAGFERVVDGGGLVLYRRID